MMRQRGFTLIETLIVIVIIGILTAMLLPKLQAGAVKRSLRGSRNTLVGLYGQARMAAMQQGRTSQLRFEGNKVLITTIPGTGANAYDTVGTVRDLHGEYGVAVTPPPAAQNPIPISPKGFVLIPNDVQVTVAKSGHADSVIISRYGGLRK